MEEVAKHFANFISRLAIKDGPEIKLAARLASNRCSDGHACVNLAGQAGGLLPAGWTLWSGVDRFPALSSWRVCLEESGVVGRPGSFFPLILDGNDNLYLQRYWLYEKTVAEFVRQRGLQQLLPADLDVFNQKLDHLFPGGCDEVDWQQIAAIAAATKPFCIITGGPGTGKTTTVAKILALIASQKMDELCRIALVAPTGKAAARLYEAIRVFAQGEHGDVLGRDDVMLQTGTLHRLIGKRPRGGGNRYDAENPLPFEVIVVDEASMVDLPLMARLMQAVPVGARLILLGDRDQLASVEPGSVFGDLCPFNAMVAFSSSFREMPAVCGRNLPFPAEIAPGPLMSDGIVHLQKNYRFDEKSGIQKVTRAVREGDALTAWSIFEDEQYDDLIWHEVLPAAKLEEVVGGMMKRNLIGPAIGRDFSGAYSALENSRLLCALRKGPYGVDAVNRLVRQILVKKGRAPTGEEFFPGQPVMVVRNDYALELFNGDVGIVVKDQDSPSGLTVLFPGNENGPKRINPALLPPHEPVFAVTVHKSQGMEFDHVCLLLPDRLSPVLTRELIYTAISRAKKKVEVWGKRDVFEEAVRLKVSRESGLKEVLWTGTCCF